MPNDVTNTNAAILTLDSDAVLETAQSKADLIWHDIQNAYRTRKILTGTLGGIEKTEAGNLIAVIYYKEFRAVIPITEMMINLLQDEAHDYGSLSLRQNKVLNNMLGCEIDFIIKGLDTKTRSIVASRKEAMLKKRQIFYLDQDVSGQTKVYVDRIRYMEGGDHARANHQRLVLEGIMNTAKKQPLKLGKLISTVLPQCKTSLSNDALTKLTLSMARCKIEDSQAYPFKSEDERYNGIYYGFPITAQTNVKKAHEYLFGTKDYKPTEELQKISAKIKVVTDYIGITE